MAVRHLHGHARRVGPDILDGKQVSGMDRLKYALGDLLVYGPLKNTLGFSRVRVGYTAGEAIGPEIFDFYRSLGINLKQLYGQTEATVFITQQPDGQVRSDTVGVPSPGVEVKIGDTGEVFYRSPGTFVEYYKNPDSTARPRMPKAGWPPAMQGSLKMAPGICASSTAPRMWARWPMAACSRRNMWKTS
jgi:long-chain acyl-CoA synthetase